MRHEAQSRAPLAVLAVLAVVALVAIVCFMTLGARGSWSFVLAFRGLKLAALVLIATAIAISTVLFQTITGNRILTPSIMGFDALYALVQTVLVFLIGAGAASGVDPRLMFAGNVIVMVLFSLILYRFLFSGGTRSLHLLMLVGIVFGVFFRSISGFLQRIIDPNDFVVLQDRLFASFNTVDTSLLGIATGGMVLVGLAMIRYFHTFDVLSLGREAAITLGVDYRHVTTAILVMVAVLVSISTALVGPVTFFGLLVANLAYLVMPSGKHQHILPAAVLIAIVTLVGGQVVLERVFAFDTALSVVIEFAGGLFFILYLVKGGSR